MARKGGGFDQTTEGGLWLSGRKKGLGFQVLRCRRRDELDGPLGPVAVAIGGRSLTLKYTRVPRVPDWQLQKLMDFEVGEIAERAGEGLAADYNLLPVPDDLGGEDIVLLALARTEALDAAAAEVQTLKGSVSAFTPQPIALYNAFLVAGPADDERTRLLVWAGDDSLALALVRGGALLFARDVAGGLGILDQAIAGTFNVRTDRARRIRRELLNLDPAAKGRHASSQAEKVAHAVAGVAGQLQAALRSTLAFCRSQIQLPELSLDGALLCGPGASVRGLDRFLADGLGVPVDVWNPVPSLDLSACRPEDRARVEELGPSVCLALGLAAAPCFDELYSIEILPEAVKRRRRFFERTAFTIAAAVLAAAYLGGEYVTLAGRYDRVRAAERRVLARVRSVRSTHESVERLSAQNANRRRRLLFLEEQALPLHGAVRILRALHEAMPRDLWLVKLKSTEGGGRGRRRRRARHPLLTFEGRGKPVSGRPIETVYATFKQALVKHLPGLVDSTTSGAGFRFRGTVDFLPESPAAGGPAKEGR